MLAAGLMLVGCKGKAPAPSAHEGHDHSAHHAAVPENAPKGPTGPRLETDSFVLEVASADPKHVVGKVGEVAIALEGRGPWHVNQDYPIRVDLKASPGLGLPQQELAKGDAKEFGEDKVRFVAGLEPAEVGEHEVTCDVSFAMCTDENCVIEERTVAMQIKVE